MARINYKYRSRIHILLLFSSLIACVFSSIFSYVIVRQSLVTEIIDEQQNLAESIIEMEDSTTLPTSKILHILRNSSQSFTIVSAENIALSADEHQRLNEKHVVTNFSMKSKMPVTYVQISDENVVRIASPGNFNIVSSVFARLVYFVFTFIIISLIASWISSFSIANPVSQLIHATDLVQQGDYSVRLPEDRNDELGNLIHSFNSMTESLAKTSYLQKDFISSISHEFKTPIASIHGFAKLLKNENLSDDQRREYLDIIDKESERLSKLSATLLRLASLEQRSEPPAKKEFQLDEQIRQVILRMETSWEPRGIEWNLQLENVAICSDSELLNEVWMNLIQNAIKFSPDSSTITITLRKEEKIVVTVADQGIGMTPETVSRIFDRFYQGESSHSYEGVGLGLSLVKRILDILSGEISVDSTPGKGSIFTVRL